MKVHLSLFLACCLVAPFASGDIEVAQVIENLASDDYELRQQARFDLESLVAQATAPDAASSIALALEQALLDTATRRSAPEASKVNAVRALAILGNERAAEILRGLAADTRVEALVRDDALRSLSSIPGSAVTDLIVEGLLQADPGDQARWWVALTNRTRISSHEGLLDWLEQQEAPLSDDALLALGKMGGTQVARLLFQRWDQADGVQRLRLEQAILNSGASDEGQLKRLLAGSSHLATQTGAYNQWLELNQAATVTYLESLIKAEPSEKRGLLLSVSLDADISAVWDLATENLARLTANETLQVLAAIAEQRKAEYEAMLIDLAQNQSGPLQLAAVRALGFVGGEKAVVVLLKMLGPAEDDLEEALSGALARVKDPKLDETMIERAREGRGAARTDAIEILAIRNSPGATELLNGMLSAELSGETLEATLDALESIGNTDTCRIMMMQILSDTEGNLKKDYQLSLKRLTIRLNLAEQLWESVYSPALTLATQDQQKEDVVVILDGLSSQSALDYCTGIIDEDPDTDLADTARQAMSRWRNLNICEYWASVVEDEASSEEARASALRAISRVVQAEYVDADDGNRGRTAADLFIEARDPELRATLIDAISSYGGWARGSFYWRVKPYLDIADFRNELEALIED